MITINTSVLLPQDTPMTYQQLVHQAIDARTYSADPDVDAAQKEQAKNFFTATTVAEGFVGCVPATVYVIDAYKGVQNGVADPAAWLEADFTNVDGGGQLLPQLSNTHFFHRMELGAQIVYSVGADAQLYLYFSFS